MKHDIMNGGEISVPSCSAQVVLDLWEHLEMCKEGQMSWLSRQLDEANFIITVCSKGLRYFLYFITVCLFLVQDNFRILQHTPYFPMFLCQRDDCRQNIVKGSMRVPSIYGH